MVDSVHFPKDIYARLASLPEAQNVLLCGYRDGFNQRCAVVKYFIPYSNEFDLLSEMTNTMRLRKMKIIGWLYTVHDDPRLSVRELAANFFSKLLPTFMTLKVSKMLDMIGSGNSSMDDWADFSRDVAARYQPKLSRLVCVVVEKNRKSLFGTAEALKLTSHAFSYSVGQAEIGQILQHCISCMDSVEFGEADRLYHSTAANPAVSQSSLSTLKLNVNTSLNNLFGSSVLDDAIQTDDAEPPDAANSASKKRKEVEHSNPEQTGPGSSVANLYSPAEKRTKVPFQFNWPSLFAAHVRSIPIDIWKGTTSNLHVLLHEERKAEQLTELEARFMTADPAVLPLLEKGIANIDHTIEIEEKMIELELTKLNGLVAIYEAACKEFKLLELLLRATEPRLENPSRMDSCPTDTLPTARMMLGNKALDVNSAAQFLEKEDESDSGSVDLGGPGPAPDEDSPANPSEPP